MMFWILLSLSQLCPAYIPEYATIASHAAEQHGKGGYLIEQEVTFRKEAELFTVKETWQVLGENNMRVTLEGRGPLKGLVQGTIIYEGSLKSFIEQNPKNQRLGDEWLEPLLHFRSSKYFRSRLVNLKVAPPESLQDRGSLNSEGDPKYEKPSFIRLSRVGGAVAWAIGVPPSVGNAPTVWIQQDHFVLRKFKSANQVIMKADDYAKYDESIWYPRSRSYVFGPHTVQIQTLQVKPLGKISSADARFRPGSLVAAKDALKLPDAEGLKEFYSRFR